MSVRFVRARPLQAGKLVAIVVALPVGAAAFFGLVGYPGVLGLFLLPLLGVGLTLVVVGSLVRTLAEYYYHRAGAAA